MLRVAVVEDDLDMNELIQSYIRQYQQEHQLQIDIAVFQNGREIAERYNPVYDVILLDIEMPEMDGMEAARRIRGQDPDVVLMFITNIAQYAVEGYSVGALALLDAVDLYSMLGNALDNAIEGVRGFEEKEKRLIDVLIRAENKLLLIQIINLVAGQLTFQDGLPASTKTNDGYHGFGLKSIRYTAQKYGGFVTVNLEHDCFVLRVLLPLSDPS